MKESGLQFRANYVRCMFARKWWDDAASLSFPYFLNDKV